jgi:hypothetical protein
LAKYAPPGVSEVAFTATASDYTAITVAECNAATDLTSYLRTLPDIPRTTNLVDVATLDSKFEKRQVGTRGGDVLTTEILRDSATDTAYTTLAEDTAGYLIVARAGLATAGTFASGDVVDVFPVTVASIADGNPGRNDPDFAVVEMAITSDPERNQTLST